MSHETWPDAPGSLIARWEQRRRPMRLRKGQLLGGPVVDLAALAVQTVPLELPPLPPGAWRSERKERTMAPEFAGKPALWLLHALTIAHLRKRSAPPGAAPLFHAMWREQRDCLLGLPIRWLISAVITFADHGQSESERRLGAELNVLFTLMKLYESERLFSGRAPETVFRLGRSAGAGLPLGMAPFSLRAGDADINLLAPIWQRAEGEPVLGPLATTLLARLNAEPGTIFARLTTMQRRHRARGGKT